MSGLAPGRPGFPPRWTPGAKSGVGTAFGAASRVWFTLGSGVVEEVYFPRVDVACIRDVTLLVSDGHDFFSDENRDTEQTVAYLDVRAPAYRLVNTCKQGRYRLEKEVCVHPERDALLMRVRFVPLVGALADYHLFVVVAPHLDNLGTGNTGWVADVKGVPMLLAQRGAAAAALASSAPWRSRSAGYVGVSDGYLDVSRHKVMTWSYERAEDGNVALTGELELGQEGVARLALGFGTDAAQAAHQARAGIQDDFDDVLHDFTREWRAWHDSLLRLREARGDETDLFSVSMSVLHTHEGKQLPGSVIASLSIPWRSAREDAPIGGYHLVWIRDMVEAAFGLLAAGARDEALRVICYLQATQEADGHWPQNMWASGLAYWNGVQLDETGLPILLVDTGWRDGLLDRGDMARLWPMVRRAAGYIVRHGPATEQDRWEEASGYSPYTLAVEIAALLAAADLAELAGEAGTAAYLRETADAWNTDVEHWTWASGTELAGRLGVSGYYVRIAPGSTEEPWRAPLTLRNLPAGADTFPASSIVSCDALALVRFGLRAPDDPRILDTIEVVDALTRVDTPSGPAWHRYNHDGYGEKEDGAPFDGTGVGRAWPLLTGERAHYELAAGRPDAAAALARAMEAFAGEAGMLPEQVWDTADIPARGLSLGRPTGSAMPLVWAHAEYVKLRRSLRLRQVFDMPPQTRQRYQVERRRSTLQLWKREAHGDAMPAGRVLRVELSTPARVRFSTDGWATTQDLETRDTGFGIHLADLPTASLHEGDTVRFTFFLLESARWEGADFAVAVRSPRAA